MALPSRLPRPSFRSSPSTSSSSVPPISRFLRVGYPVTSRHTTQRIDLVLRPTMALQHVLLEPSFRSRGGVWTSTECHVCVSSLNVILHRSIGGISNLRASAFWAYLDQSKTWVNNSYDASDILIGLLMRDFYLFCTFPCLSCEAVPGLVLYWSAPFPYRS